MEQNVALKSPFLQVKHQAAASGTCAVKAKSHEQL